MQYYQQPGRQNFDCGVELEGRWRRLEKVMDSGQNPVEPLLWGLCGWKKTIYVYLYYLAN